MGRPTNVKQINSTITTARTSLKFAHGKPYLQISRIFFKAFAFRYCYGILLKSREYGRYHRSIMERMQLLCSTGAFSRFPELTDYQSILEYGPLLAVDGLEVM